MAQLRAQTPQTPPQALTLTPAARRRLQDLLKQKTPPVAGLRVGLEKGGCAGMTYTLDFTDIIHPQDEVVTEGDVRLIIDPKALLFLLGTQLDYQEGQISSGFIFNNPNQTSACGCGESVAITPIGPEPKNLIV